MADKYGIDISAYQPNVDYALAAKDINCQFVILRCGGGDNNGSSRFYKDSKFETHYSGFKAQGTPIGVYYFGNSTTTDGAIQEAKYCKQYLEGKQLDLPVFYDVEASSMMALSNTKLEEVILAFLNEMKDSGYQLGIYTSGSPWRDRFTSERLRSYVIWCALWTGCDHNQSAEEQFKKTAYYIPNTAFWQYGGDGGHPVHVNGISGSVDADVMIDGNWSGPTEAQYYYCHPLGMKADKGKITTYDGHNAIDISLNEGSNMSTIGTPIYSMTDGKVTIANYNCGSREFSTQNSGGNYVQIDISNTALQKAKPGNYSIAYMHLVNPSEEEFSKFKQWKVGDTVKQGDIIGGMGCSGHTEGSEGQFVHCHIQMRDSGNSNINLSMSEYGDKLSQDYSNASIDGAYGGNYPVVSNGILHYDAAVFSSTPKLVPMRLEGIYDNSGAATEDVTFSCQGVYDKQVSTIYKPLSREYVEGTIKDELTGACPTSVSEIHNADFKALWYMTNICFREFGPVGGHDFGDMSMGLYAKLLRAWYLHYNGGFPNVWAEFRKNPTMKNFADAFQVMRVKWVGSGAGNLETQMAGRSDDEYLHYMQVVYKNFKYGNVYYMTDKGEHTIEVAFAGPTENNATVNSNAEFVWRYPMGGLQFVLWRLSAANGSVTIPDNINKIYTGQTQPWKNVVLQ